MRKITRIAGWTLLVLLALTVLARLSLAPIAKKAIIGWFEDQGVDAELRELEFEVGEGVVTLAGLQASVDGQPVLRLERLALAWSWSALYDNEFLLKSVAINGVDFGVEQGPGDKLVIAGVDLTGPAAQEAQQAPAPADDEPLDWSLSVRQFEIDDFRVCYRGATRHDYCSEFEKLAWDGSIGLDLAQLDAPALPLQVDGTLRLVKLEIQDNRLDRALLEFSRLALDSVRVDSIDDIALAAIELESLALLERASDSGAARITQLENLSVTDMHLARRARLEIAEVDIGGHEVLLVNQSDGGLEVSEWFPSEDSNSAETETARAQPTAETETGVEQAPPESFSFSIGKLVYRTDKSIQYEDRSLPKPFVVNLNSIELILQNLDSLNPEQPSSISYAARYAEHGIVKLEGTVKPLSPKPSFDIAGRIEGLDLRDLSPFTAQAVGHTIKSGQLDADLVLKAENGQLDSLADLTLHQFNLSALSAADKEKMNTSFGFPLNASLSLLKDRDNRIELSIPITGDLQNPDFDPSDAITKATSKAITAAVLNYYTPFGLISLADGLFSLATALRFEPVVFASGNGDIEQADRANLEKIASLMQDRPGVHVTICAFTSSADRAALMPETAEIALDELELDETQLARLQRLGETRSAAVKQFLAGKQIDAARLILCAPEHEEGEGLPRVEISI